MAIKSALGKLETPTDLAAELDAAGFTELPVGIADAMEAGALLRHHDDPFDRMLVAQAQTEGLVLVSADRQLEPYEVERLPA